MRNSLMVMLLITTVNLTISQEGGEIPIQLPQIFPVSPEAASLGKYGDVPVNLASGKLNHMVPLYTIKVADFEWPIYLSYNYSGFMVEQDPGYCGLGWDFMATGRITREIKGIPDELDVNNYKANTIIPYLKGDFNNLSYEDYEAQRFQIYNQLANLNEDGEFDNYIISAGAVNGTFKINENNESVFLTHRNYIAEKDFIIDDRGIKYYFDEIEVGEYNISNGADSAPYEVPSSYLLTKIELPNNAGNILFFYKPFNPSTDSYFKKVWTNTEITGIENKTIISNSQSKLSPRILDKITFPNGEVHFNITSHNEIYSNQHGPGTRRSFALNNLSVYNNTGEILKYNFTYSNVSKSNKVLKTITKSKGPLIEPYFTFSYNNESGLNTNHDYTAQDYWGYYNGDISTTLLQASREIDPIKTKYGALETITYPTGGSTTISYEQNQVYDENATNVNCSYSHNDTKIIRLDAQTPNVYEYLDSSFDVGPSQIVRVIIKAAVKKGTTSNALGNEAHISVLGNNASNYCGYSPLNQSLWADAENCASYPPNTLCNDDLIITEEIIGYAHDGIVNYSGYVLEMANKEAFIEITIHYENVAYQGGNKLVGGLRVSSTVDCDNESTCVTTNYNYNLNSGQSSGVPLGGTPQFEYSTSHSNEPREGGYISGNRTYRSAKSRYSLSSYQGASVLYENVKITLNNGDAGYTENKYTKGSTNTNPGFPFLGSVNYDWKKGKLLESTSFKKTNKGIIPVKKTTNQYQTFYPFGYGTNSSKIAYGMNSARSSWRYSIGGSGLAGLIQEEPNDYVQDYNYYFPKEHKLVKTITESFHNENDMLTSVDYIYDDLYLQPKEIITTDSKEGLIKSKMYYAYDLNNTSLIAHNRISTPIKIEKSVKVGLDPYKMISTKNIVYDFISGLYMPIAIQDAKGSQNLEDRINYYSYDSQGNPIEISQTNGPITCYIWGYNKQHPIAKIENAIFSDIPTSVLNAIISASDLDTNSSSENSLRTELEKLRSPSYCPNLTTAMVTTYTYDPLIGVTSITDPRGQTVYYEYDDFNRLKRVIDNDQKILSENQYHYAN